MRNCQVITAVALSGVVIMHGIASAAPPTAPPAGPAPVVGGEVDEARRHYDNGLQLYDDGAMDAARAEFERAYQIAPSYKILYNIALVHKRQADFVGALTFFDSYLEVGGSRIPDIRQQEVTREIAALRARIGAVEVHVNVPGADVSIDDVAAGKSPLPRPILVNLGRRKISATKAGRNPVTLVIDISGAETKKVTLDLVENHTVVLMERPQRRVPWIGWGLTGAFALTAGIFGYSAVKASSDLDGLKQTAGPDPGSLRSLHNKTQAFSIVADVATVGAVVAGGLSLYYTIKWGRDADRTQEKATPAAASVSLGVGPGTASIVGKF